MVRSVLVTGNSGYIGSHFVKHLARAGHRVCGLDKAAPPRASEKFLSAFRLCDIGDSDAVFEFAKRTKPEAVIHCAALAIVSESVEKPDLYRDNNYIRARKLADTLTRAGVGSFVFSSTAAVYGEPQTVPIPEEHPKAPINPYGATKLAFENDLLGRAGNKELSVGILRYFNAAGADPEAQLGEDHNPETHLIPNALRAALGHQATFEIYGDDYPTRDGSCERDFIHVWDLAQAHVLLMERMLRGGEGGVYNLGTGAGFTVKEVLDEIDRQVGSPLCRTVKPRRSGDPAVLVADPRRAKSELGWSPRFSDLSTIVSTALVWHRSLAG